MKTLYLDVSAGAAGDMLMGALYGLYPEPEAFLHTMNTLPLPGIRIAPQPVEDQGVHMAVTFDGHEETDAPHHHHHPHRTLDDILARIRSLPLPEPVLENACAVYAKLAEAEARAHGEPVAEVHFHEVGMNDAIADITGVCLLLHLLAPDEILACPVAVGSGTVPCAHGVLPVPAPATENLLEGLPSCPGAGTGELCTPTGAALLRHFVDRFGPLPEPDGAVSYGFGSRRIPGFRNAVGAWTTAN